MGTNIILLLHLNDTLKKYNSRLLRRALGGGGGKKKGKRSDDYDDDNDNDIELIAECIDSLQRLCRYVHKLHLKLHMGHLLSYIIIGISRALVSFGDIKSQKYASEWLDKITTKNNGQKKKDNNNEEEYVKYFETFGI